MSQNELAARCGLHPRTIVKVEAGEIGIRSETLDRIQCALGYTLENGAIEKPKVKGKGVPKMKQWDMHIGIFDINFDTGERYWSAELRRILRVPDGMPVEFLVLLQHVHPDDRRALVAFSTEPLQGKCPRHRSFEHRLLDPDGAVRWVHIEAGAAFRPGSEGDAFRVIGLVVEIAGPRTPATPVENLPYRTVPAPT